MFESRRKRVSDRAIGRAVAMESLEGRRLLSGSSHHGHGGPGDGRGFGGGGFGGGGLGGGPGPATIAFSLAPTAVQTGLDHLATADGLTTPAGTQVVDLNNVDGVETYSIKITGTGTVSRLTVDQLGDGVTAPTQSTTTFANVGSGAAAEITAIASSLNLSTPASTDTVNVSQASTGAVTYSVRLASNSSSTTDGWGHDGQVVSVDSAGNPVGNQRLPFGVFSTAVRNGLNGLAPTGATALTSTSTIDVRTIDGVVTYSATFTAGGTTTTATVGVTGAAVALPVTTTTAFSNLSSGLQTELQTLATAKGVTTTIAAAQTVDVYTEANGTVIYSVTLSSTDTADSSVTTEVTISVDSSGNPTTPPHDGGYGFGGPGDGFGGRGGPGDCGPGLNGSTGSNSSSGTNVSNGSSSDVSGGVAGGSISIGSGATVTATAASLTASIYKLEAKLLGGATGGLGMLGNYFVQFAPALADSAVVADLTAIVTSQKQLATDTKALTKTERATLKADTAAIATATKALKSTLAPLQATLKADVATWKATLKLDGAAVRKAKGDATASAAAKAKLIVDGASAFAAVAADEAAIQSAIDSDGTVVGARAKLATDLPTIATDQSTIKADQATLVADIGKQLASA